jgi:cobalamin transport system substrate-binding protein
MSRPVRRARPVPIARAVRSALVALLALAALFGLAGPAATGAAPAHAAPFTLVDQTGRTLALAEAPRRIVSLVPSVSETLFALGAEDRLVGVTDFCDFPPAARAKPRVGGMVAPSLEAIAALRPDVVVVTPAGNSDETFAQLARLRLPTFAVNPIGVGQVIDLIARLGALAERPAAAAELAATLSRRIRVVTARVAGLPRPRVLYVVWPEPLIVPGRGSIVSELIDLAGGESVTADGGAGYPRYSVEAALARNPEVIVLARHGNQNEAIGREPWERFTGLPAIRKGRLHAVNGDVLHRYGPRVVDGLEELARLFHPAGRAAASTPPVTAVGPR